MDPERIPVVVGVGQVTHKPKDIEEILEPVDHVVHAIEKAREDAGGGDFLRLINMLCVTNIISWGYENPPTRVAERIGAKPGIQWYTGIGACAPQWFVSEVCDRIAEGRLDMAVVCGGESFYSQSLARRLGEAVPWKTAERAPEIVGDERVPLTVLEQRYDLFFPTYSYALFENAVRYFKRQKIREHQHELGNFCAAMSSIAKDNPYAWFRKGYSPEEIIMVSPQNRMVAFPYTKIMCSMMNVDQGAAVIIMSLASARRWKVPEEKMIFPIGAGEAWDQWYITHREVFYKSPSAKAAADIALCQAHLSLDEVDFLDLYSCFPCAPRIVRETLGLSRNDRRPITVTGGMPYFGGPGNNYSLHAICRMVEVLREHPMKAGLVQALSWFLHKHAVGIYRTIPDASGWHRVDPEPFLNELKSLKSPEVLEEVNTEATVETYTVVYKEEKPHYAFLIGRTLTGGRFLAKLENDPDTMEEMVTRELIGEKVKVRYDKDRGLNTFRLIGG